MSGDNELEIEFDVIDAADFSFAADADIPEANTATSMNESDILALDHVSSDRGLWDVFNGDSCELVKGLPDSSIGFTVYSPLSPPYTPIQTPNATWAIVPHTKNSSLITHSFSERFSASPNPAGSLQSIA